MTRLSGPAAVSRRTRAAARVAVAATFGSVLLALAGTSPASAADVTLQLSTSSSRSAPVSLTGATAKGNVYIFTAPDTNVSKVSFWLDDPQRTGAPRHVEGAAPFDFAGTNGSVAYPFATTSIADGSHNITASVVIGSTTSIISANFTVANGSTSPPPSTSGVQLQVSTSSNRSAPVALSGSTVRGLIYVFTAPDTGVSKVSFWLDDPQRTGPARRVEQSAPFDFNGGSPSTAQSFNTVGLVNGGHTITAQVVASTGTTVLQAPFTVSNTSSSSGPTNTYTYSPITPQTKSETEAQGVVIGGRLYQFGGFAAAPCCPPTKEAWMYDVASAAWSPLPAMPSGGFTHAGMATDGGDLIWYAGGYPGDACSCAGGTVFATKEVWQYRISTKTYTRILDLPVARGAGALTYLDGRLNFFGGHEVSRTVDKAEHWQLDLRAATPTWVPRAPMPKPLNHLAAAVLGGKIYSVGGQIGFEGTGVMTNALQQYDPVTNTWTMRRAMPLALSHTQSSVFVLDGRIVIAGGMVDGYGMTAQVSAYSPSTDTWSAMTPLPQPRRSGIAGALFNSRWIYSGGTTNDGNIATPAG